MQKSESSALVSVIIPTFNSVSTIYDSLKSVLEQDYSHMEIIVVNNGSTDDVDISILQKSYYGWCLNPI